MEQIKDTTKTRPVRVSGQLLEVDPGGTEPVATSVAVRYVLDFRHRNKARPLGNVPVGF